MNNNNIYTPPTTAAYVENPFDRQDPAGPQINRPHLPNEVVTTILRFLPTSKAHEFMTLAKSYMGVNRVAHLQNLLAYKTSLTGKDLNQHRKIFSIGLPQIKSISETFGELSFPNVTHLDLSNEETLTDADLIVILRACPNLTSLNLEKCKEITDASILELVKNGKNLTSISLKLTKISDLSIDALIEHCPKLAAIDLEITKTSIEKIKLLAQSRPNLTEIHLSKKDLSNNDLRELSLYCPLLESITLNMCSFVGDTGIQALAENCPNLRSIRLLNPQRVETGLHVVHAGITNQGLNTLATHSKKLSFVEFQKCYHITLTAIENLMQHTPITTLKLRECGGITNTRIKALAPHCTNLTTLDLHHEEAPESGFWSMPNADYLKDDGLAELTKQAKNLTSIDISGSARITDAGIKALAENCPNLVSVNLSGCSKIEDKGLEALAKNCRKLDSVNLLNCSSVGNKGIQALVENGSNLKWVWRRNCMRATNEGIAAIRQANPKVTIQD